MRNTSVIGWCAVLLSAPALAQSINIKFGLADAPVPDASYGAMGPAGYWNLVNHTGPAFLHDVSGNLTTVANFIPQDLGPPWTFEPSGPTGNDALLLNAYYNPPMEWYLDIHGLRDGRYNAIFYGLSPLGPLGFLAIAGGNTEIYLLGDWPGQWASGVFGVVPMTVTNGTMSFYLSTGFEGGSWSGMQIVQLSGPGCTADVDGDGDPGTDADIEAFFACLAGTCCARCSPADFNGDGDVATDADIESFFRVLAGQPC